MSPLAAVLPGLGFNTRVLMKHETVYGTAATSTAEHASEIMTAEVTPRLSGITDPSLTNTQRSARFVGQGGLYYEWTVKVRVGYNGMLPWLRMMFPSYAGSLLETGVNSHIFKETAPAGTIGAPASTYGYNVWGYTLDFQNWAGPSGTLPVMRLIGALATGMRFTAQAGTGENAMLLCEISGVAKSATAVASGLTTVALPTALGVIYHQQSTTTGEFGDASGVTAANLQVKSFELNLQQPYDTQRFLFGQVNAEAPVPNGIMTADWSFEEEYVTEAQMVAQVGNSQATVKTLFRHPTLAGTTKFPEFELRSLVSTASEYGTAVPGYGVITQRVGRKAYYNTTDASAVVVRIQSTDAIMSF